MANQESPTFAWSSLIPLLAMVPSLFGGGGGGSSTSISGSGYLDPQILEMLNEQRMRQRLQNPLYEEVTQLARALMPKSAKPTTYQLPGVVTPDPPPVPERRTPGGGGGPQPRVPPTDNTLSQAVQMMASGLGPINQAKLYRR